MARIPSEIKHESFAWLLDILPGQLAIPGTDTDDVPLAAKAVKRKVSKRKHATPRRKPKKKP